MGSVALGGSLAAGCAGDDGAGVAGGAPASGAEPTAGVSAESAEARAVVESVRAHLQARKPAGVSPVLEAGLPEPRATAIAGLAPSLADRIDRQGDWLLPHVPATAAGAPAHRATVALASMAAGGFRLAALQDGMEVEVALVGAREAAAEIADGFVVYRHGHESGADLVFRATADGAEDYLAFESAPQAEEITYELALRAGVAGVRLVGRTLELLDAGGAPRLRMAAPYLVDAAGQRHEARVDVSGCAHDTDPRGPWGRAVTAPGAAACTVRVGWGDAGVKYPIVLDPAWTTTGSLTTARKWHTATALGSGKVLVAGGYDATIAPPTNLKSAELYDPTSGTWSVTGSMSKERCVHTASLLGSGKVLVAGGAGNSVATGIAELYDESAGTWTTTGAMSEPREEHTATVLADGRVVLVGGWKYVGGTIYLTSTDRYDPTTGTWSTGASTSVSRKDHTAVLLSNGKVLIAGGRNVSGGTVVLLSSAELYDPAANSWSATSSMSGARVFHTASVLSSGKILVAGGVNATTILASTEVYDPTAGTWTTKASMITARDAHTATVLSSGKILVAGGVTNGGTRLASAELYDPTANSWSAAGSMSTARYKHTASLLGSGQVLVAGGQGTVNQLASAELY